VASDKEFSPEERELIRVLMADHRRPYSRGEIFMGGVFAGFIWLALIIVIIHVLEHPEVLR
jgi:ABC-type transport system involved in multi-copper enzyme maturation permease subunit